MGVTTNLINKPLNPRAQDASPLAYNRAALYSGKALDFDGTNDSVSTGTQTAFDMKSIAFYFIGAIDSSVNGFVMHPNDGPYNKGVMIGHFTSTLTNECLSIGDGTNYTTIKETFDDGIHFAVFSWDATNSKYKIFVNGVELTTENNGSDSALISGITSPVFGKRAALNDFYLDGSLSNIRLFDVALTPAQIADLYNFPEKIVPTGVDNTALKLWLPMMEGAGTTAYDGSGNGNHGTISGATYVNGVGAPVNQTAVIDWNKGTNIVPYSEELDEWTAQTLTISQSAATAPDGSTNAYDLNDTNSGAYGILLPSLNLAMAGDFVGSVFIKKTTGSLSHYPGLDIGQVGSYLIIDTTNGTAVDTGSNYSDITITSYNDDWWRVSAKATINATKRPIRFWPALSDNGTSISVSATGTNTFWGAQVEQADAIGPYIYTGATAQTTPVLLPAGLTTGRDITGVNLFENVRKQGALNLDGSSWAEVHDNASLDVNEITAEGWMYAESITGINNRIVNKWNSGYPERSFQLYGQHATINWMLSDGSAAYSITGGTLTQGQWFHVVGTYDGSTQKIYLNGVQVATTALSITLKQSSFKVMLGGYATGVYSNNPIAQPRIYNRALTNEEIQRNFNAGKNIYS